MAALRLIALICFAAAGINLILFVMSDFELIFLPLAFASMVSAAIFLAAEKGLVLLAEIREELRSAPEVVNVLTTTPADPGTIEDLDRRLSAARAKLA